MRRKSIYALLVMAMSVSLVSGCGSSTSETSTESSEALSSEESAVETTSSEVTGNLEQEVSEVGITEVLGITDLIYGYDMMAGEDRGEKSTLTAYNEDKPAEVVSWSSSDEGVVSVDKNGVIWAKGIGSAEVTASTATGDYTVPVTVKENMTIEEVVDKYFSSMLEIGDVSSMSAAELVEKGNEFFYIPHSIEGADEEIIESAKNREFPDKVAFYSMAEAYYNAAIEKEADNAEAAKKLEELNEYKELIKRLDPDGQGICFSWFAKRNDLSPEQMTAFAYDDVFFFEEPQYRGMDTLISMVGDLESEEGIDSIINLYRFNAIYLGKGGAYTEISRFYIDKETYPNYPKSMNIGIDYLKWSFDPEVVATTDFKGPRYLGDYYASGWTDDKNVEVDSDYEKAAECYNIALSNKGAFDLTACLKMAFWNHEGEVIEKNDELAFTYLVYGFYQGSNLHATQTNMPEGLLLMGKLFEAGVENATEADAELARTFYTYAYKSAEAMIGNNDEVNDSDMETVIAEVQKSLEAMGTTLDDNIVISDAPDDFDADFETILKPYIGLIETNLGVKGVK